MKALYLLTLIIVLMLPKYTHSTRVITKEKILLIAYLLDKQWQGTEDKSKLHPETLHIVKYLRNMSPSTVDKLQFLEQEFKEFDCREEYEDFLKNPGLQSRYKKEVHTYSKGMRSSCALCISHPETVRCLAHSFLFKKALLIEMAEILVKENSKSSEDL